MPGRARTGIPGSGFSFSDKKTARLDRIRGSDWTGERVSSLRLCLCLRGSEPSFASRSPCARQCALMLGHGGLNATSKESEGERAHNIQIPRLESHPFIIVRWRRHCGTAGITTQRKRVRPPKAAKSSSITITITTKPQPRSSKSQRHVHPVGPPPGLGLPRLSIHVCDTDSSRALRRRLRR